MIAFNLMNNKISLKWIWTNTLIVRGNQWSLKISSFHNKKIVIVVIIIHQLVSKTVQVKFNLSNKHLNYKVIVYQWLS